jgi:lipopolysaccharide/colanic/teichoic acid biosynthesis glycosyltransferase
MSTVQLTDFKRIFMGRNRVLRQWHTLVGVLAVLDALCVLGALMLAYLVRIDGLLPYFPEPNIDAYLELMRVAIPIFLASFAVVGLYRRDNLLGGVVEYKQVAKGCTAGVMLLVAFTVFARSDNFDVSRLWLVLSWLMSIALVGLTRFFVRRVVYRLRENGVLTSRVIIVGANDQGLAIAAQWSRTPTSGMHVVGFLDDFKSIGTNVIGKVKVIGRPSALDRISRDYDADEIVVVSTAVAWESFGEIVTANGADKDFTLRLSPGFYDLLTTGIAVTNKTFVPLLTIHENRIVGFDAFLKSLLDFGLGILLAIVTLPLTAALAIALRVVNPGAPVFTRTPVLGQGGKPFTMLRFNTASGQTARSRGLAFLLRASSLDKLPQLSNVLRGQMSLIGPRPRAEVNQVTDMHTLHNLLAVKPGIIGPSARHDHLKSPDDTLNELNYVRNWQIWLDLPILFESFVGLVARSCEAIRRLGSSTRQGHMSPRVPANLGEDPAH